MQITLAELKSGGAIVWPDEAVAITRALCEALPSRDGHATSARLPSESQVAITSEGRVVVLGDFRGDGRAAVSHVARLLHNLLPETGTAGALRVPADLTVAVVKGLGDLALPTFGALQAFADELQRFAPDDPGAALRHLYARCRALGTSGVPLGPRPVPDRPPTM